jgi:hypothetical protein
MLIIAPAKSRKSVESVEQVVSSSIHFAGRDNNSGVETGHNVFRMSRHTVSDHDSGHRVLTQWEIFSHPSRYIHSTWTKLVLASA